MKFLENDLEQIIYDNLKTEKGREMLMGRGLQNLSCSLIKRQLSIGGYGIADIITLKKELYWAEEKMLVESPEIIVWELKKDLINLDTLLQAIRYVKGIKRYLDISKKYRDYEFKIKLIGKNIDTRTDWVYLFDVLDLAEKIEIYKYSYKIDGIYFEYIELSEYYAYISL